MNNTKNPTRSTQQIFLDEIVDHVTNAHPDLVVALDYTASNQLYLTVYDALEPVIKMHCNFQADYARIDHHNIEDGRGTGWGNGMKSTPRDAFDAVTGWIAKAAG